MTTANQKSGSSTETGLANGQGQQIIRNNLVLGKRHRGSAALNQILANNPNLVSFTLFIRHHDENRENAWPGSVDSDIWNDGKRICYAPDFEKRSMMFKIALVIKHLLKIALCHPQRARRLKRLMGSLFDERIFIFASDIVIHQSFVKDKSTKYEKLEPTLNAVIQRYLSWCAKVGVDQPKMREAEAWSVEDTYYFINRWREQMKEKAEELNLGQDDIDWLEQLLASLAMDMDLWSADAMGGQSLDGMADEDEKSMLNWSNRFRSAQAGDKAGGILRNVEGDVPIIKTPWKTILRADTMRAVTRQPENDWSRPSRSMITNFAMGRRNIPYEPARANAAPSPKIAILVDTSGSIDQKTLEIFAATMNEIQRTKRTELRLIIGDAAVEEVVDIRPNQLRDVCKKVRFKGAGGTDFRPLIAKAIEWKPDIIVYLTDLCGTFPEKKPKCPMIWAVIPMPGMSVVDTVPFGKVIMLE